jgi:uncharacterized protein GlcG (DUF336 family)
MGLLSFCVLITAAVSAQTIWMPPGLPDSKDPPARGPSMALALEAAQAVVAACRSKGAHVAVSVIDSAGILKAQLADDGANKRAVVSSLGKAMVALDFRMASSEVVVKMNTDNALAERVKANSAYIPGRGGLLLTVGSEVIGAIGVGGDHSGTGLDEVCSRVGLEKVRARLK